MAWIFSNFQRLPPAADREDNGATSKEAAPRRKSFPRRDTRLQYSLFARRVWRWQEDRDP